MAMGDLGECTKCGKQSYVIPLHSDRGGPLFCPICVGAWNAEYTKRRKWGRIIVKAMKAYEREGGRWHDFDKLKLVAAGYDNRLRGPQNRLLHADAALELTGARHPFLIGRIRDAAGQDSGQGDGEHVAHGMSSQPAG